MADPVTVLGIGMKAVGWVASPIISELFKKCSSYLDSDTSVRLLQLGPKVLLLERTMEAIQIIPHKDRLAQLYDDLKTAFYEAEDILDDVEYQCLEKKIQDDKFKLHPGVSPRKRDLLKKKVSSFLPTGSPLKNKETGMSHKRLKDILEKIEKTIYHACNFLERLKLGSISNGNERHNIVAKNVTTAAPPLNVIGRDEDLNNIIAMLHVTESDGQPKNNSGPCYSVIGIHGIGGSGKSTLAQLVCAREKKDKQEKRVGYFNLVMWVHISQSFSVDTIYREIFEAATGNSCPQLYNLDTLQNKLEEKLQGKRFLLVLDDVWYNKNVDEQTLPRLLSPLKVGKRGSKILVTTRNKDVFLNLDPGVRCTAIPIRGLDDKVFSELFMHYALGGATIDDQDRRMFEMVGAEIAKKLKGSPLAAKTIGGQLRKRQDVAYWKRVRDQDLLNGTMGALWWSYQHLDEQARRCFAYCSIFPRRYRLYCDELVNLWVAEGFIRTTNEWEDMDDVGREYFDELVSTSFLQPGGKDMYGKDYYLVHDLLHDLAETVAGSDCFRIENKRSRRGEGWKGYVPRDVRYLFVQYYDRELVTEKILELVNLRTLIIYTVSSGTPVEEKVIESIFERLSKLRVLAIALSGESDALTSEPDRFSLPESISQLKHLRYLAFRTSCSRRVILPSALTKLYHMQLLDFGKCGELEFSSGNLIKLRHVFSGLELKLLNIGRLTSLETIPSFRVRKEKGYEVKELRNLNKLRGSLYFSGLGNVKSKEEALEANLAAKERLTCLSLSWGDDTRCSPDVEAEVLEGLCPPVGLETLHIWNYKGLRYPNWMVGKQNGGPKDLQELEVYGWSQLGPAPRLEAFIHLRVLMFWDCSWDALPGNMKHLTSLKVLGIYECFNIRLLPTLPPFLEEFNLGRCNGEFMKSCRTVGHQNWQKIEHVPKKIIWK